MSFYVYWYYCLSDCYFQIFMNNNTYHRPILYEVYRRCWKYRPTRVTRLGPTCRTMIKGRRTRKLRRPEIYVKYLKKQKGGRLHDITTTFQSICTPEDASAKIRVIQTLKSPEEGDDFIHVLKSAVDNQDVVIKIQDPGYALNAELMIHNHLRGCNNIIRYICDFRCLLDISWKKPIEMPRCLCDSTGEPKHIIVMEYINSDLAQFLGQDTIDNELFCSVVKQAGFALLDFHINKSVWHNDINRGNILLHIDNDVKNLIYTICGRDIVVNTLGHEVIYIDFQRGHIVGDIDNDSNTNEYVITNNNNIIADSKIMKINTRGARDEISHLFQLMSRWTTHDVYKARLEGLMWAIMKCKTCEEMLSCIESL